MFPLPENKTGIEISLPNYLVELIEGMKERHDIDETVIIGMILLDMHLRLEHLDKQLTKQEEKIHSRRIHNV